MRNHLPILRVWVFFLLGAPLPASAKESYYLLLFAYEGTPNDAEDAHSFGVFVREVSCCEADGEHHTIEYRTISWLPANFNVRVKCLLPEKGHNYTLEETLDFATRTQKRVSLFGPFQIKKKLYEDACKHADKLERGKVMYKAIDTGYPTFIAKNCIHALSDLMLMPPRLRVGTPAYGEAATYRILLTFYHHIITPSEIHEWLLGPLGLEDYPFIRRSKNEWHLWLPKLKENHR